MTTSFKELLEAKKVTVFDEDGDRVDILKQTKGAILVKEYGRGGLAIAYSIRLNLNNSYNDYGNREPDTHDKYGVWVEAAPTKYLDDGRRVPTSELSWTKSFWVKGLELVQNDKGKWSLK